MPTLAGNKHFSVRFFLDGLRPSPLSMEKVSVQSVRNGHHSGFSRTDTLNKNKHINKDQRKVPLEKINKNIN